jgi:hypothetical protein
MINFASGPGTRSGRRTRSSGAQQFDFVIGYSENGSCAPPKQGIVAVSNSPYNSSASSKNRESALQRFDSCLSRMSAICIISGVARRHPPT